MRKGDSIVHVHPHIFQSDRMYPFFFRILSIQLRNDDSLGSCPDVLLPGKIIDSVPV